jgi:hypothetical protein
MHPWVLCVHSAHSALQEYCGTTGVFCGCNPNRAVAEVASGIHEVTSSVNPSLLKQHGLLQVPMHGRRRVVLASTAQSCSCITPWLVLAVCRGRRVAGWVGHAAHSCNCIVSWQIRCCSSNGHRRCSDEDYDSS